MRTERNSTGILDHEELISYIWRSPTAGAPSKGTGAVTPVSQFWAQCHVIGGWRISLFHCGFVNLKCLSREKVQTTDCGEEPGRLAKACTSVLSV